MAAIKHSESTKPTKPRWYVPTPAKFLFAVLAMQGVLFLSAHYRWFWFNERKGYTVLITVAATSIALLALAGFVVVSRFFRVKSQFGLATLLLMVPVMAIPCGWLARESEQARQQREIVELGYQVKTDPKDVAKTWLTETLGPDFFRDVTQIYLIDSVTGTNLEHLKGLAQLQELSLSLTQGPDDGLKHLKGLTKLQVLTLEGTQVTDAGLEHLKGLAQLQVLLLSQTQVTDAGLEHLKGLPKLHVLYLYRAQVTDAGLEHLKGLTKLNGLALNRAHVTDAGLEHLDGFTQLQELYLKETQITDTGLEHLKGLSQLQSLDLRGTQVTDAGVNQLKVALPNCKIER